MHIPGFLFRYKIKNKTKLLPTRTTFPRTTPRQDDYKQVKPFIKPIIPVWWGIVLVRSCPDTVTDTVIEINNLIIAEYHGLFGVRWDLCSGCTRKTRLLGARAGLRPKDRTRSIWRIVRPVRASYARPIGTLAGTALIPRAIGIFGIFPRTVPTDQGPITASSLEKSGAKSDFSDASLISKLLSSRVEKCIPNTVCFL